MKYILRVVAGALLAVGLTACTGTTATEPDSSLSPAPAVSASDGTGSASFFYLGEEGVTALDLLVRLDPMVEISGEGEMAFVTAINGQAADPDSEYWKLSVDGAESPVGAGSLITKAGQVITWTLTEF